MGVVTPAGGTHLAPRVSVVLAVYNGERHLWSALHSVLNQDFADFELIVVDDGSTDGTPEILSALQRADPRAVVIRQEHLGLTASLNKGIGLARGSFIARQDADDISLRERFTRQIAYLEAHMPIAALGTFSHVIDRFGTVRGTLTAASGPQATRRGLLTLRRTPTHGSMMIRKDVLEETGGYREAFRVSQDYDLWLRLTSRHEIDILPDVLYQWRLDSEGVYATRRTAQLKYAGIALAFAHERALHGQDSYELLKDSDGDLNRFVAHYRLGAFVHATWGELLLRGLGNSPCVRQNLTQALLRGHIRPWTVCLFGWTHLGLPWPGGKPLSPTVTADGQK